MKKPKVTITYKNGEIEITQPIFFMIEQGNLTTETSNRDEQLYVKLSKIKRIEITESENA
ncbi:MAG: hypothetical protein LBH43_21425 [Treponema sp.]|jgi:hypothetical protein|nr:hypothetical protein [Treponema sp.]